MNEIIKSPIPVDDKIIELLRLKVPKYKIQALLKEEGATKSRVELQEHWYLIDLAEKLAKLQKERKKKKK